MLTQEATLMEIEFNDNSPCNLEILDSVFSGLPTSKKPCRAEEIKILVQRLLQRGDIELVTRPSESESDVHEPFRITNQGPTTGKGSLLGST